MGFVNEELTQEERELFAQRNIVNPLSRDKKILIPKRWTIDREKQAYIIRLGVERDWPDEEVFFYQLRERHIIISVRQRLLPQNTVVYSLGNTCYSPLDEIKDSNVVEELKEVLKRALDQFKTQGTSDDWNMSTRVICEF